MPHRLRFPLPPSAARALPGTGSRVPAIGNSLAADYFVMWRCGYWLAGAHGPGQPGLLFRIVISALQAQDQPRHLLRSAPDAAERFHFARLWLWRGIQRQLHSLMALSGSAYGWLMLAGIAVSVVFLAGVGGAGGEIIP